MLIGFSKGGEVAYFNDYAGYPAVEQAAFYFGESSAITAFLPGISGQYRELFTFSVAAASGPTWFECTVRFSDRPDPRTYRRVRVQRACA